MEMTLGNLLQCLIASVGKKCFLPCFSWCPLTLSFPSSTQGRAWLYFLADVPENVERPLLGILKALSSPDFGALQQRQIVAPWAALGKHNRSWVELILPLYPAATVRFAAFTWVFHPTFPALQPKLPPHLPPVLPCLLVKHKPRKASFYFRSGITFHISFGLGLLAEVHGSSSSPRFQDKLDWQRRMQEAAVWYRRSGHLHVLTFI